MPNDEDGKVCGDELWCGLPAGHDHDERDAISDTAAAVLFGHRITDDGVFVDLPAEVYHADPVLGGSLSASGAVRLTPPSVPAKFDHWRRNPDPPTPAMRRGTAAHALLLGVGAQIKVIPGNPKTGRWDRDADKADVAAAQSDGYVPMKPGPAADLVDMVAALREHPVAGALFAAGTGVAEAVLIAVDPTTQVAKRGMLDWLPRAVNGRILLPDYKTCEDAGEDAVERAIANFAYHQKMAWYRSLILELGLAEDVVPYLVFQEVKPPFLVHPVKLDVDSLGIGAFENREALRVYAECSAAGVWHGYGENRGQDPTVLGLPAWLLRRYDGVSLPHEAARS